MIEKQVTREQVLEDLNSVAMQQTFCLQLTNADGEFDDSKEYAAERIHQVHLACMEALMPQ